jgi:hypothetical protein
MLFIIFICRIFAVAIVSARSPCHDLRRHLPHHRRCDQPGKAWGMDHGFDASTTRAPVWMEKQLTPKHNQSCCGKGDGYFVDRYRMNADGSFTVYIADSGDVTFPDGTERPRLVDQDIVVPVEAVNPLDDDVDNPFDHSVVWLAVYQGRVSKVWCFIPTYKSIDTSLSCNASSPHRCSGGAPHGSTGSREPTPTTSIRA